MIHRTGKHAARILAKPLLTGSVRGCGSINGRRSRREGLCLLSVVVGVVAVGVLAATVALMIFAMVVVRRRGMLVVIVVRGLEASTKMVYQCIQLGTVECNSTRAEIRCRRRKRRSSSSGGGSSIGFLLLHYVSRWWWAYLAYSLTW